MRTPRQGAVQGDDTEGATPHGASRRWPSMRCRSGIKKGAARQQLRLMAQAGSLGNASAVRFSTRVAVSPHSLFLGPRGRRQGFQRRRSIATRSRTCELRPHDPVRISPSRRSGCGADTDGGGITAPASGLNDGSPHELKRVAGAPHSPASLRIAASVFMEFLCRGRRIPLESLCGTCHLCGVRAGSRT